MTFQNIFSSLSGVRDVVIKASKISVAVQKANPPWEIKEYFLDFDCYRSRACNIRKAAAYELIGAKKGAIFSLIYFFKSFCIYYISHNYVIPQAMPHATPQTHSASYPHQLFCSLKFSCRHGFSISLSNGVPPFSRNLRGRTFFFFHLMNICFVFVIDLYVDKHKLPGHWETVGKKIRIRWRILDTHSGIYHQTLVSS